jgi:hypothetical protein
MYTADVLRDLLWPWGDGVKHGHWPGHPPADPDVPRLAVSFGPRLPCRADFLDISRAFAALNPALPTRIDDLGFYRATGQFTRQQLGLWLFYVEGWGARRFRDDWQAMSRRRARSCSTWSSSAPAATSIWMTTCAAISWWPSGWASAAPRSTATATRRSSAWWSSSNRARPAESAADEP